MAKDKFGVRYVDVTRQTVAKNRALTERSISRGRRKMGRLMAAAGLAGNKGAAQLAKAYRQPRRSRTLAALARQSRGFRVAVGSGLRGRSRRAGGSGGG